MRRAAALLLCLTAPVFAGKQTFRDVPKNHWAYPAIKHLVRSGMIQGKKGTFSGNKAFTRYEMAVVLARYMEKLKVAKKGLQGTIEKTYPLLKKLAKEFSAELDLLGVKHQDLLARVTSLETRMDMHHGELQEIRALVEENRRMLLAAGHRAVREVSKAPSAPRGAAARPSAAYPPVYRRLDPPPARPGGRAAAPLPRVAAPAPAPSLFASAPPSGAPRTPDALRLQNLRLRARGLLDGGPVRQAPAPSAYPTYAAHRSAPAPRSEPGLMLGTAPQSASPGLAPDQQRRILDTMDRVRTGELDLAAAERYGQEIEQELGRRRQRRSSAQSQVYPLHERLFGPMGLGPPAGD